MQNNAVSVQQFVDKALSTICKRAVTTTGCGRTDTGVHATQFYLHFDTAETITDCARFLFRGNALLPDDIVLLNLFAVSATSHARFDAASRTYHYIIHHHRNPFVKKLSSYVHSSIDINLMNDCCKILKRHSEYGCFSKSRTQVKTFTCVIDNAKWYTCGEFTIFTITADRFLRGMVRAIVGTLLNVNSGKISMEDFEKIIMSGNRQLAGRSVSPDGLYLTGVVYPYITNVKWRMPPFILNNTEVVQTL